MKKLIMTILSFAMLGTSVSAVTMYREEFVQPSRPSPEFAVFLDKNVHEAEFQDNVVIYARNWGFKTIDEYAESEKTTLYFKDKTLTVPNFLKQTYMNLGWSDKRQVILYALDGREQSFAADEVDAQCAVGWYKEKPVRLYTLDGRAEYFLPAEVDAQCEVGWYRKMPVTLYTLDGRSAVFPGEKADEQRAVGWYYDYEIKQIAKKRDKVGEFYIGQRVWRNKWNAYFPVGRVTAKGDTTLTVEWDAFYTYDWDRVYSQSGIKSAEQITGITLGRRYTYDIDEISAYK